MNFLDLLEIGRSGLPEVFCKVMMNDDVLFLWYG